MAGKVNETNQRLKLKSKKADRLTNLKNGIYFISNDLCFILSPYYEAERSEA